MGTAPASTWKVVAVGDYDGNGLSDVLLQNQTTGKVGHGSSKAAGAQRLEKHGQRPVSTWKVVPGEVAALQAASVVTDPESDVASLTQSDLRPIVAEAIARWAAAGLDASTVARLTQVHFVISDLPGSYLGEADGSLVYLDSNAAGHGWFIDPTPELDEEFAPTANPGQLRAVDPRAVDRIDLLTVVEHELGHVAGFGDLDALSDNLMSGVLGTGIRRDPQRLSVDAVLATT